MNLLKAIENHFGKFSYTLGSENSSGNEFLDKISGLNFTDEMQKEFDQKLQFTIDFIKNCFITYGIDKLSVSFNGGKDCTVLLYLCLYVLKTCFPSNTQKLALVYIVCDEPFDEIEEFVSFVEDKLLHYKIERLYGNIKGAFQVYLEKYPQTMAIFEGTRNTDPYSDNLPLISNTTHDWPQFIRVCPLISWGYKDIWYFLLRTRLPYCKLYNIGYTSIGSLKNTRKNEFLKNSSFKYHPAYFLEDVAKERNGRHYET